MKTSVGTLALLGAVLLAGSALAQTPPQRGASSTAPAARSVSGAISGVSADEGQTRGTNLGQTPVNGIGGFGGGRLSNVPPTNDPDENGPAEGAAPATGTVPGGQGQGGLARGTGAGRGSPGRAEAPINTSRSNIKKPSLADGTGMPGQPNTSASAPATPR